VLYLRYLIIYLIFEKKVVGTSTRSKAISTGREGQEEEEEEEEEEGERGLLLVGTTPCSMRWMRRCLLVSLSMGKIFS